MRALWDSGGYYDLFKDPISYLDGFLLYPGGYVKVI